MTKTFLWCAMAICIFACEKKIVNPDRYVINLKLPGILLAGSNKFHETDTTNGHIAVFFFKTGSQWYDTTWAHASHSYYHEL